MAVGISLCVLAALILTVRACGQAPLNPSALQGDYAQEGSWPWQASLHWNGQYLCGGSLINSDWVLTSAICFYWTNRIASQWTVYLGRQTQLGSNPHQVSRGVQTIILHPYTSYFFYDNIALLKLSSPVNFTDYIQPVCLADTCSSFHNGTSCWLTGWGNMTDRTTFLSGNQTLQQVQLPLIENKECVDQIYNLYSFPFVTESMICAGVIQANISSCSDLFYPIFLSGSPLVCKHESTWIQAGVVNFRNYCPRYLMVHTGVSNYKSWIKEQIGSNTTEFEVFSSNSTCNVPTALPDTTAPSTTTAPVSTASSTTTAPVSTASSTTTAPVSTASSTTTAPETTASSTTTAPVSTASSTTTAPVSTASSTTTAPETTASSTTTAPVSTASSTTTAPVSTAPSPASTSVSISGELPIQVCGRPKIKPRLLKGQSVAEGSWPWMANLYWKGRHVCGGTLITGDWVMTAAQCLPSPVIVGEWKVVLGKLKKNVLSPYERSLGIQSVQTSQLGGTNIALLKLVTKVSFTKYILPICLAGERVSFPIGTQCWITGWRNTTRIGENTFQEVSTAITKCMNVSSGDNLCTGPLDLQQGESGDPLVCKQGSVWIQASIVAVNNTGGPVARSHQGVFPKVSRYQSFLQSNVGPTLPLINSNIVVTATRAPSSAPSLGHTVLLLAVLSLLLTAWTSAP